jgi:hypothetical protein
MHSAMSQVQLSARAYHQVLNLSRTIAVLAEENQIAFKNLAEESSTGQFAISTNQIAVNYFIRSNLESKYILKANIRTLLQN